MSRKTTHDIDIRKPKNLYENTKGDWVPKTRVHIIHSYVSGYTGMHRAFEEKPAESALEKNVFFFWCAFPLVLGRGRRKDDKRQRARAPVLDNKQKVYVIYYLLLPLLVVIHILCWMRPK